MSTGEVLHHSVSLPTYIKWKLKMLSRDFHIRLTESEINHMQSLKTEIAVDNYARKLIFEHL